MFKIQRRQCATCIYRADSPLDVAALEAAIRDPRMPGHFAGHRVCHHSEDACCAGFWARHKDDFDAGQIAQRLRLAVLVDDDTMEEEKNGD
jgi:hypothetical protein